MSKYWSNEDDNQVSYSNDRPVSETRPDTSYRRPVKQSSSGQADDDTAPGTMSAGRRLERYHNRNQSAEEDTTSKPNYGGDRSTFISEDMNRARQQKEEMQFAPPPKFSYQPEDEQRKPAFHSYTKDGYEVHTEAPPDSPDGKRKRRGWRILLAIVMILAVIAGGAYLFRYQILELAGQVFGEEIVWKIMPTAAPTSEPIDIPAYVESAPMQARHKAANAIDAITDGVEMETYIVTESNIVMQSRRGTDTSDYYLFDAEDGRLLGYYEGVSQFVLCAEDIFYIDQPPYLITSQGYPLVQLASLRRSVGSDPVISPMTNGWALIANQEGTTFNFIGTDGKLISDLWFSRTFPFTADTTIGYVDTGNVTDTQNRYALYMLHQDGGTDRLSYGATTDNILESVCGMAFMRNGDMYRQGDELTYLLQTDDAAAYVNCGALVVRDPDTTLYGLFVDGVQQYDFEFESIEPLPSDLQWAVKASGFVRRYTVESRSYPLPRSYSFILKKGNTQQIVSIVASSAYPILFD